MYPMIEEAGVIVGRTGDTAKVAIVKKSACESCAAAGACHPRDADRIVLEAANAANAEVGQTVKIMLMPQTYANASIVRYGVPAVVTIGGAIFAKNIALPSVGDTMSNVWALMIGTLCLVVSFIGLAMYNKRVRQNRKYRPVVVEILHRNS